MHILNLGRNEISLQEFSVYSHELLMWKTAFSVPFLTLDSANILNFSNTLPFPSEISFLFLFECP